MLRITIDLVPFGHKELTRKLGEIEIINDGTGSPEVGNYIYRLFDADTSIEGELKEHNRAQSVFKLLKAVLNKALF